MPRQAPPKKQSSTIAKTFAGLLAVATLIGGAAAAVTFLPRITIDADGDFSNPSSINFKVTNAGIIPLEDPDFAIAICQIKYGDKPTEPAPQCDFKRMISGASVPPPFARGKVLRMDESFTMRLEDMVRPPNPRLPITRAIFAIVVTYSPWFLPWRMSKAIPFQSVEGTDGKLYWRANSLQ